MNYLVYLFLIIFLIIGPLQYHLKLAQVIKKWVNYLKFSLFVGRDIIDGQKLLELSSTIPSEHKKSAGMISILPKYKYHTDLLLVHYEHLFKYGGDWREKGHLFREALSGDLQKEKEFRQEKMGNLLQIFFLSIFVWSFYISLRYSFPELANRGYLPGQLLGIQTLGILFFIYLSKFFSLRNFREFSTFSKTFQVVYLLSDIGISFSEILERSSYQLLKDKIFRDLDFNMMQTRLDQIIQDWRFSGKDPSEELNYLGEDLRCKQLKLQNRLKMLLGAVKLVTFIIFFLGSYFWIVLSFTSFFIEDNFMMMS